MSIAKPNGSLPHNGANGAAIEKQQGTLTRQDIALAIYNRFGNISRREAKRLIDAVIDEMVETLTSGESLKLHDFGSFIVRSKHERAGRNPRTGEPVPIQARRVIVFKASPNMKATVNGAAVDDKKADAPVRKRRKSASEATPFRQSAEAIAIGE